MVRTNPLTSVDAHQAALKNAGGTKERILAILRAHGPLTLDGIVKEYMRYRGLYGWPLVSEQGIRSRTAELAHEKPAKVVAVEGARGVSRYHNPAKLWEAVEDA
jgi:hypothetical protein